LTTEGHPTLQQGSIFLKTILMGPKEKRLPDQEQPFLKSESRIGWCIGIVVSFLEGIRKKVALPF
jgi:hypothetical protein